MKLFQIKFKTFDNDALERRKKVMIQGLIMMIIK